MLASEVLDETSFMLNDIGRNLYTYSVMTPGLRKATKELEKILTSHGVEANRVKSGSINVNASTTNPQTLTLPADFFLPIRLFERNQGATNDPWEQMIEQEWESETAVQTSYLRYWAFRNNAIYMIGSTANKEVLLEYERILTAIVSENTTIDLPMAITFLAARTAELCARFIGMNSSFADEIAGREVEVAKNELTDVLVLNMQGLPARRGKFTTQRLAIR